MPATNTLRWTVILIAALLPRASAADGPRAAETAAGQRAAAGVSTPVGSPDAPLVVASLPEAGTQLVAKDSLQCDQDPRPDAQACLEGLRWSPSSFTVEILQATDGRGDRLICFPSPRPEGNAVHDRVAMEWYAAKNENGDPVSAPAVVVVHESGRSMPIGRMIARQLRGQGLHAMLIHLPGYGHRRTELADRPELMLSSLQQAIADVRRARDAVAALPIMTGLPIGVQGTSLGGFVTSTVAGLDGGFDRAFIMLAGGNLHQVVLEGKKDAAQIRQRLHDLGIKDEQIESLAKPVEPLRLAHRIRGEQTWLYNGMFDDVVPRASSYALAAAAGLPEGHHVEWPATHYTGIIFLPVVIHQIHQVMLSAHEASNGPVNKETGEK